MALIPTPRGAGLLLFLLALLERNPRLSLGKVPFLRSLLVGESFFFWVRGTFEVRVMRISSFRRGLPQRKIVAASGDGAD